MNDPVATAPRFCSQWRLLLFFQFNDGLAGVIELAINDKVITRQAKFAGEYLLTLT